MLRNFSHIILSFLLLFATTGMAVSKHFCDEFLISTSLFSESEPCCNNSECCQNESSFYQLDEDFSAPAFTPLPKILELELFIAVAKFDFEIFGESDEKSFNTERKSPPLPKIQTALSLKQAWLL
ncbi:MAG: hypothetical protein K0B11_03590 [Mariniphaga sp.]|nr:hypothetical protein [Mariniphaga sp.]